MSYRVILAPLDGGETDGPALRTALSLAREFNGHVDALCLCPPVDDELPSVVIGLPEPMVQDLTRVARTRITARRDNARQTFDRACASLTGVAMSEATTAEASDERPPEPDGPSVAWRECGGIAETLLPWEARKADLIVFSHTADTNQLDVIEATLLGAGRPLLLVPPKGAPAALGRTVAIAWNSSIEATRAVAAALPFIHRADNVYVLTANASMLDEHDSAGLVRYLHRHGVEATIVMVRPGLDDSGPALIRHAEELGVDLMVMGAYGYSRTREFVFGGVTRHALHHPRMALLLTH